MPEYKQVAGTPYEFDIRIEDQIRDVGERVDKMRASGALSPQVLGRIRKYFRLKDIYHSNAIEGNVLTLGETRQVVEAGLTITGKPLKDSIEAKNLAHALDYFEQLATDHESPLTEHDIRQIHALILGGIDDENAGAYRKGQVEISGSSYKPPAPESVSVEMRDFGDWLKAVSTSGTDLDVSPLVLAAAAHAWFVMIHPFVDGNGRTARIVMNLMLMRHGYPIAVITKDDRDRYYDALEDAQSSELSTFVALIAESVSESLEEYERAAVEQRDQQEWAQSLISQLSAKQTEEAKREYEIWKAAMDLLKSYFNQATSDLQEAAASGFAQVYFKDFGIIEFEKYLALRKGESAKRTWFFRVDFKAGEKSARYLFFFGFGSPNMRTFCPVTVHLSRESQPFYYERLDQVTHGSVPDLREVGFDAKSEQFVFRESAGGLVRTSVERAGKLFIDQIVKREF